MLWGIDRLVIGELGNTRRRLRTSKIAVLSQASAVDRRGVPCVEALQELGIRPAPGAPRHTARRAGPPPKLVIIRRFC